MAGIEYKDLGPSHIFAGILGKVSLKFWEDPDITFKDAVVVLITNMALIAWCRYTAVGVAESKVIALIINSALVVLIQYFACFLALLQGPFPEVTGPKLVRLFSCAFILSLIPYSVCALPGLNWDASLTDWFYSSVDANNANGTSLEAKIFRDQILVSIVCSAMAVVVLIVSTLWRWSCTEREGTHPATIKGWCALIFWAAVVFIFNTMLFYAFILNEKTYKHLKDLIGQVSAIHS
jgi:hypothetical protein